MTKCFFDNAKLVTKNSFLSNAGPKFTPSSNHFDTGEKLIITSSVTKDVYIRPCILLIRHHMQIYTSTSGLFTRILVVRNSFFNHNWWLKRFCFEIKKCLGFVHHYSLLGCFQNKEIDSKKTLLKRQYTNGSTKEQQFLNKGSSKLYCSHREKK